MALGRETDPTGSPGRLPGSARSPKRGHSPIPFSFFAKRGGAAPRRGGPQAPRGPGAQPRGLSGTDWRTIAGGAAKRGAEPTPKGCLVRPVPPYSSSSLSVQSLCAPMKKGAGCPQFAPEKGDRLHAPPPPLPPKKRGPIARAQLGTYSPFAVLALGVGGTGVGLGIRVRHPLTVAKVSSGHTTRTSRNAWRAFFRKSFTVP